MMLSRGLNTKPRATKRRTPTAKKQLCEVRVFGSRVGSAPKKYSDLDIAVIGKQKVPYKVLNALKEDFEESDLPFRADVLDWNAISDEFKTVINKKYELLQRPAA